ncbi:ABC transporter permease [Bifidobacterium biavatii]|uniref:Oligopeptide transport system permease AppC n=1 Tax=Bifidobacterium biavatii DSM 23969 TaxID=1437608 RepID=A0A087A1S3_9BIFI|nr:ABC transporter permease [Bifidobacterium biavatii]KFI52723.1 oligopeptide transport system permease AppC [Bifidobacterium biavatii DSM 23969]
MTGKQVKPKEYDPARIRMFSGCALLLVTLLVCFIVPILIHADPYAQDVANGLRSPYAEHIMGTDALGRDIFARLLYGGQTDLIVAMVAVIAPLILGTFLGASGGYYGGWLDTLIMRIADVISAFPFYVLAIALVFVIGNGMGSVFTAIAIVSWVPYCRLVRAEASRIKNLDFISAAKMGNLSDLRIIINHVMPNVMHQALTYAVTDASANIGVIVTLSYFGMGLVPPQPDWGQMLSEGQQYFANGDYYLIFFPALAIIIASFAFSLIGEGLNVDKETR